MRPRWTGLSAAVCAAAFAGGSIGCVDLTALDTAHVERDERRFTIAGRADVMLTTFDGAIEVRTWDRPEVLVVVERRGIDRAAAASIEVAAAQDGGRVVVEARVPRGSGALLPLHRSARLVATVPTGADVRATSGDGSIDVAGVNGRVVLRTGDGSIRAQDIAGALQVQTGDGSVRAGGIDGELDVATGDGSVRADGRLSRVRARSGDGSLVVSAAAGSRAGADWDISTGDGSVTLAVPDGFSAELDARTDDGRIRVHDLTVQNVTGGPSSRTLHGTLGAGGRSLRIQTGDGSITLRRQ